MNKKIVISILFGLFLCSIYIPSDSNNLGTKSINYPKSASIDSIILIGNEEVDAFFSGNGTDGLSYETAYCYNNSEIDDYILIGNSTRYIVFDHIIIEEGNDIQFQIINCSNIYVINSTLHQSNSQFTQISIIGMDNNQNINLINNLLYGGDDYSNPIYIENINDILIQNNTLSGGVCLKFLDCINVIIINNTIRNIEIYDLRIQAIQIENSSNFDISYNEHISSKEITQRGRFLELYGIGDNINITYNIIDCVFGIECSNKNDFNASYSNIKISNNIFIDFLSCFIIYAIDNLLIEHNVFILTDSIISFIDLYEDMIGRRINASIIVTPNKMESNNILRDNTFYTENNNLDYIGNILEFGTYQGLHLCKFQRNFYYNYFLQEHSSYETDDDFLSDRFLIDGNILIRDTSPRWHWEGLGYSFSLNEKAILTNYDYFIFWKENGDSNSIINWIAIDFINYLPNYTIYIDGDLVKSDSAENINFDVSNLVKGNYNLTIIYNDGRGLITEQSFIVFIVIENSLWKLMLGILIPIIGILSIPTTLYFIGRKKSAPKKVSAKVGKITCNNLGGFYRKGLCTLKKKN